MRSYGNIELREGTSIVTEGSWISRRRYRKIEFELHDEELVEEEWEAMGSGF